MNKWFAPSNSIAVGMGSVVRKVSVWRLVRHDRPIWECLSFVGYSFCRFINTPLSLPSLYQLHPPFLSGKFHKFLGTIVIRCMVLYENHVVLTTGAKYTHVSLPILKPANGKVYSSVQRCFFRACFCCSFKASKYLFDWAWKSGWKVLEKHVEFIETSWLMCKNSAPNKKYTSNFRIHLQKPIHQTITVQPQHLFISNLFLSMWLVGSLYWFRCLVWMGTSRCHSPSMPWMILLMAEVVDGLA